MTNGKGLGEFHWKPFLKDGALALSCANLMFLRVWRELLFLNETDRYWTPDFTRSTYVAALLNLVGFASLFLVAALTSRRLNKPWLNALTHLGFLAMLVFPIEYFRTTVKIDSMTILFLRSQPLYLLLLGAFTLVLAALVIYHLPRISRWLQVLVLILSPFALSNLGHVAYKAATFESDHRASDIDSSSTRPEPTLRNPTRPRIVWLLFDELDADIGFVNRPAGMELPNFDRLLGQSLSGMKCKTHRMNTSTAIPSFFAGVIATDFRITPRGELAIEVDQSPGEFLPFTGFSNVFRELTASGRQCAVAGFYHPYHRFLANDVAYCAVHTLNTYTPSVTDSIGTEMASQILGITPLYRRVAAVRTYREKLQQAVSLCPNDAYDVVYVHVTVPHGPWIYDRNTGHLVLTNVRADGYIDNLILADQFLGKVRDAMERAGVWDEAVVLVTSDHEWREVTLHGRKRTSRTPYILKMPNQKEPELLTQEFSPTLVTKDLLLAISKGELRSVATVKDWLRTRATR